jgi:drug/metabolite transporter (DMT)-like permease
MPHALRAGLLALAWGLNWPAVKVLLQVLPPFTLRAIGLGAGALLLLLLARLRGHALRPLAGDFKTIVIGGALTVVLFNFFTAFAQLATTTTRATVLTYTMPMLAALLAWLVLGERPGRRGALALVLGALGIAVLAAPVLVGLASPAAGTARGLVFPLAAALAWAAGSVVTKRWPARTPRLVLTGWQLALGAVAGAIAMPLAGESGPLVPGSAWPAAAWLALGFHIVCAMALAYTLWFALLAQASVTVSALTTLAVPVVGVTGAMLLVGDRPSFADWAGFALVLAAAALVSLPARATARPADRSAGAGS